MIDYDIAKKAKEAQAELLQLKKEVQKRIKQHRENLFREKVRQFFDEEYSSWSRQTTINYRCINFNQEDIQKGIKNLEQKVKLIDLANNHLHHHQYPKAALFLENLMAKIKKTTKIEKNYFLKQMPKTKSFLDCFYSYAQA